jgi:hypothetical protein
VSRSLYWLRAGALGYRLTCRTRSEVKRRSSHRRSWPTISGAAAPTLTKFSPRAKSLAKDTLKVYPAENITPELTVAIQEHKADVIRIMREDEEFHRTGVIQSERQVFELARDHFGLNQRGGATRNASVVNPPVLGGDAT